jgi:hypothetical protein
MAVTGPRAPISPIAVAAPVVKLIEKSVLTLYAHSSSSFEGARFQRARARKLRALPGSSALNTALELLSVCCCVFRWPFALA